MPQAHYRSRQNRRERDPIGVANPPYAAILSAILPVGGPPWKVEVRFNTPVTIAAPPTLADIDGALVTAWTVQSDIYVLMTLAAEPNSGAKISLNSDPGLSFGPNVTMQPDSTGFMDKEV